MAIYTYNHTTLSAIPPSLALNITIITIIIVVLKEVGTVVNLINSSVVTTRWISWINFELMTLLFQLLVSLVPLYLTSFFTILIFCLIILLIFLLYESNYSPFLCLTILFSYLHFIINLVIGLFKLIRSVSFLFPIEFRYLFLLFVHYSTVFFYFRLLVIDLDLCNQILLY